MKKYILLCLIIQSTANFAMTQDKTTKYIIAREIKNTGADTQQKKDLEIVEQNIEEVNTMFRHFDSLAINSTDSIGLSINRPRQDQNNNEEPYQQFWMCQKRNILCAYFVFATTGACYTLLWGTIALIAKYA